MKKSLNLSKLNLNKMDKYECTEFYPQAYTLVNGEINVKNTRNEDVVILVSIIKTNTTNFVSLFDNVDSDIKCRELFKNDTVMLAMHQGTLMQEEYCITLVYCIPKKYHHRCRVYPYSYVSKVCVNKINDFLSNSTFINELRCKIKELIDICDQIIP